MSASPATGPQSDRAPAYTEFVGVYDADGGLVGEVRYVIGHLLGRTDCALCDITHSPVRRKPEWDRWVADLGVPFHLRHRNETDPDVRSVVATIGAPVVLGRLPSGRWVPVLDATALDRLDGSVPAFATAMAAATAS